MFFMVELFFFFRVIEVLKNNSVKKDIRNDVPGVWPFSAPKAQQFTSPAHRAGNWHRGDIRPVGPGFLSTLDLKIARSHC